MYCTVTCKLQSSLAKLKKKITLHGMDILGDPTLLEATWTNISAKSKEIKQQTALFSPISVQSKHEALSEIRASQADFFHFVLLKIKESSQLIGSSRIPVVVEASQVVPDPRLLPYGASEMARFLNHLGSDIIKTGIADHLSFPGLSSGLVFLVDSHLCDMPKLQARFAELSPTLRQVGLDDRVLGSFAALSHGFLGRNLNRVVEIAKRGLHDADRPLAWSILLGTVNAAGETIEPLQGAPLTLPPAADVGEGMILYTDLLLQADVLTTCTDEHHFLFNDSVLRLLSCFVNSPIQWHKIRRYLGPTLKSANGETIPASGIFPFRGLSSYVAPLLYLYKEESVLPHLQVLYTRYYCRLHTIEGLAPLMGMAELLIAEGCPDMIVKFKMLQTQSPDISLCSVVVPWLMTGFAGYLMPREYFQLWDRILGYNALELLSVLAAAIIILKSSTLLGLSDPQDVKYYLCDLSGIQTVSLLQLALFSIEIK